MEKLLVIINDILEGKDGKNLKNLDTNLDLRNDLEFDSFDLALLTAKIEDDFDIDVFEDGIVNTIGEIIEKMEK